ncbi:methyl-accepting chemotaxis protein [Desulfoscipio gibsoniae]|uniref:methyl-accepting chemotaxis protein n=1 Tax=Desulfoscipio gibsoniae TaxID=102134 RepID=UPI002480B58A|nr:methyl-accepting chemotaxis protein [Desulfoscipio gibsoniae]
MLNCAQTVMNAIAQSADLITNINPAFQELTATSQIVVEETRDAARQVEDTANILSFIRRVSDQTKLLGLNAAIEAARAGEHGRGFTVVAGEIRKLAEESNKSAAEINKMLQHFKNTIISMGEDIVREGSGKPIGFPDPSKEGLSLTALIS